VRHATLWEIIWDCGALARCSPSNGALIEYDTVALEPVLEHPRLLAVSGLRRRAALAPAVPRTGEAFRRTRTRCLTRSAPSREALPPIATKRTRAVEERCLAAWMAGLLGRAEWSSPGAAGTQRRRQMAYP
jgi:hypothetical protein